MSARIVGMRLTGGAVLFVGAARGSVTLEHVEGEAVCRVEMTPTQAGFVAAALRIPLHRTRQPLGNECLSTGCDVLVIGFDARGAFIKLRRQGAPEQPLASGVDFTHGRTFLADVVEDAARVAEERAT